ncbi:O-fucosyltransferase family protein [Clostridium manihotivorum]|uniref:Uncharacterized protein n=1 Tax=Clostridium manihotivorum TaxID=2320868 RepID=A0A410E078_9CLOT|nr:O-fucosyltransferase family protein [Clostridium manihotivorum]QAA34730.1 hypothetical protein C1I91_25560 [Clostridium manihotivorum]
MNKVIREFLDSHPKLDYIQRVIRYYRNSEFREDVLAWHDNPGIIKIDSYGNKNSDIIIYYIEIDNPKSGFFAVYKNLLEHLVFADRYNMIPLVKFPSGWLYSDDIREDSNPFEEYFIQYSNLSIDDVFVSQNVVKACYYHKNLVNDGENNGTYYVDTDEKLKILGNINSKYIKLIPRIEEEINEQVKSIINEKKVLGVHIRGTDYKKMFNGHPTYITPDEYALEVNKAFDSGLYEAIFLATDDSSVIEKFSELYGEKLLFYKDVSRSDGEVSVSMINQNSKNSKHMLGVEVIRDMVTLSHCNGIIGNLSMVCTCAQIAKYGRNEVYDTKVILSKGLNQNNNQLTSFEKSLS